MSILSDENSLSLDRLRYEVWQARLGFFCANLNHRFHSTSYSFLLAHRKLIFYVSRVSGQRLRLKQQDMCLFLSHRLVLDAPWNDHELAFVQNYVAVVQ